MKKMDLKTQLEQDVKSAIRAKDETRKQVLRLALTAIKLAEVEEKGQPLDDARVLAILHKEVKSRQEVISEAQGAGRIDLVQKAQEDLRILEGYLPKKFSQDELDTLAREVIASVGATSLREMGQVMKELLPRLEGRASGNEASQVVRKILG